MQRQTNFEIWEDLARITLGFLTLIAALATLQAMHLPFGFSHLSVLGEERNWMAWLTKAQGARVASLFWQVDGRNPLSPWWYIAVRGLIIHVGAAPFLLQLGMSWLIGVSSYLAFRSITQGRERHFALALGLLSSLFVVNVYFDDITWPFVGALSCSILCIWSFSEFVNSARTRTVYLYLSTLFWFIAFGTYSLQCGAVGAIFAISCASQFDKPLEQRSTIQPIADAIYFGCLFLLFLLIWKTSGSGIADIALQPNVDQFFSSLRQGIWHDDFYTFWKWLRQIDAPVVLAVFAVSSLVIALVISTLRKEEIPIPRSRDAFLCGLAALCLVSPTIYLESSSDLWVPGTRWRMLMQFSTPFLLLAVVHLLTTLMPQGRRVALWTSMISLIAGGYVVLDISFNHVQVANSLSDQKFISALRSLVQTRIGSGSWVLHDFLVLNPSNAAIPSDWVAEQFIETEMPKSKVIWHTVPKKGSPLKPITLEDDLVKHATSRPDADLPARDVTFAVWDGATFSVPEDVSKVDLANYAVDWRRTIPLRQCGLDWEASQDQNSVGFDGPEKDGIGWFRWSVTQTSSMQFVPCSGPTHLEIVLAFALTEENVENITVMLADQILDMKLDHDARGIVLSADLDNSQSPLFRAVQLRITVPKLDTIAGASRQFGVAVRSVTVRPNKDAVR